MIWRVGPLNFRNDVKRKGGSVDFSLSERCTLLACKYCWRAGGGGGGACAPGLTLAYTTLPFSHPCGKSERETTGMRKGGWCKPVSNQACMLPSPPPSSS